MNQMKKLFAFLISVFVLITLLFGCETPTDNPIVSIDEDGFWVISGEKTTIYAKGKDGSNGLTPNITISEDGFWVINDEKTTISAVGKNGENGKDGITPTITISEDGFWVINDEKTTISAVGKNGENGKDGVNGKDGITPTITISEDGFWVINDEKTTVSAVGKNGENGKDGVNGKDGITPTITISEDGFWVINGEKTIVSAVGKNGITPSITISEDGFWVINGEKTVVSAVGKNGENGKDGVTPAISISEDGYWIINGKKSSILALGKDGQNGTDGKSPTVSISEDGFWIINGEKTSDSAIGKDGKDGETPTISISEDGFWVINGQKSSIYAGNKLNATVNVTVDNTNYGYVKNAGTYSVGDLVMLEAVTIDDNVFVGWYRDGSLIETNKILLFYAEEGTVDITAKFTFNFPQLSVYYYLTVYSEDTTLGTVIGGGNFYSGSPARLKVTYDSNTVRFDGWYAEDGGKSEFISNQAEYDYLMPEKNQNVVAKFTRKYPLSISLECNWPTSKVFEGGINLYINQNNLIWKENWSPKDGYNFTDMCEIIPVQYFLPGEVVCIDCTHFYPINLIKYSFNWYTIIGYPGVGNLERSICTTTNYTFVMPERALDLIIKIAPR